MATREDDSDSDSDASDSEVETRDNQLFYDELMDLFKSGMVDKGWFENSISEIDALRKTFNQNANAVMAMVIQGLLMLPTIFWIQVYQETPPEQRKDRAFTLQYFDQLHEILCKFQGLVAHFAKWKNAEENYKQGIEKAVVLLHGQHILHIRQDIVDLLGVIEAETGLTFGVIIDDMNAGKYGEADDTLAPGNIPLYVGLLPKTTVGTSQKPAPDTPVISKYDSQ